MTKTHIIFLLDKSGSMEDRREDTIGGFNAFLDDQKRKALDIDFSLVLFDSMEIKWHANREPIQAVKRLSRDNYVPGGLTPLWDSIAAVITEHKKLKKVLFVILTDGYENHSRKFNASQVKEMISEQEAKGWDFLYLGVEIKDMADAESIGIHQKGIVHAYAAASVFELSNTVSVYHDSSNVTYDFGDGGLKSQKSTAGTAKDEDSS